MYVLCVLRVLHAYVHGELVVRGMRGVHASLCVSMSSSMVHICGRRVRLVGLVGFCWLCLGRGPRRSQQHHRAHSCMLQTRAL